MNKFCWMILMGGIAMFSTQGVPAADTKAADKAEKAAKEKPDSPLKGEMKSLKGEKIDLADYRGKVVMIVNTASYCGNTPQYGELEQLWKKYGEKGFVVLGFPANEFGKQEPGSDAEIAQFCQANYNVTFPMMSKVVVKGSGITPLYKYLTAKDTNPKFAGDVGWNFEKFLISRTGEVVGRYKSSVKPESPDLVRAIEAELNKK